MDKYNRLENKTVLITGASAGIGYATALHYAYCGCNLILIARRVDRLKKLANELKSKYSSIKIYYASVDVSNSNQVDEFFNNKLPDEFKNIDILVNNAGMALGKNTSYETPANDVHQMLSVNIEGVLNFISTNSTYYDKTRFW